jgi:hypothetical protein
MLKMPEGNSTNWRQVIIPLAKRHSPRLVYRADPRRSDNSDPNAGEHFTERAIEKMPQPADSMWRRNPAVDRR